MYTKTCEVRIYDFCTKFVSNAHGIQGKFTQNGMGVELTIYSEVCANYWRCDGSCRIREIKLEILVSMVVFRR